MSLFDPNKQPAVPPSQNPEDPGISDPLSQLVGEGKKFKDTSALAHGKLESDKHIQNLETELRGLREELNQRVSLEQFLDRLERSPELKKEPDTPVTPQGQNLTQDDIAKTVKQILSTEKDVSSRETNVALVQSELRKAWGDTYLPKLEAVAAEVGGKEFLSGLAEVNPKAFLKLVGITKTLDTSVPTDPITPPRSSGDAPITRGGANLQEKTKAYYDKMRKEDPSKYWAVSTQMEMHRIAQEKGEAFFN